MRRRGDDDDRGVTEPERAVAVEQRHAAEVGPATTHLDSDLAELRLHLGLVRFVLESAHTATAIGMVAGVAGEGDHGAA